ncbi:metallophosphoesterase [Caldivirga maquilingensis]|uniref:Metallophosphoesterase n=1 Tax=Caldivirga maquilingensis (strain ATCC 700844 / DSM 13496 / JCM 10307 / IC-167) TaxID=397948 RepID=A8MAI7_CALMQ|nr:metallophosphoesterase [Caldivirga maquilingensis]ABW02564.1 metallophosphoesterase [Caldivirga maquilingensis IC-167]
MINRSNFKELVDKVLDKLSELETLVKVNSNRVVILGDLHGDLDSLEKVINDYPPSDWLYIGLGDYVDRGEYQVETLERVLRLFLQGSMIPLRGNHESYIMNETYGFMDEALPLLGQSLLHTIMHELFPALPYAALLNNRILLLHGGLAKGLETINDILKLSKHDDEPSNPVAFQILWNDPSDEVKGFVDSPRGLGTYLFGPDVTMNFTRRNNIDLIVRGHSYITEGYWRFHNGKVISLFTSSSGPYSLSKPKVMVLSGNELKIIDVKSRKTVDTITLS